MDIVLNSFGSALSRDSNGFVVRCSDGCQHVPLEGIRSILLGKGTQITSDAILLAIENEISILFTDKGGMPAGRVWSPKFGSISTIRKGQVDFVRSGKSVEWIKDILSKKIDNQQAMILLLGNGAEHGTMREKTIKHLSDYKEKIKSVEGERIQDVAATFRGLEGSASRAYFEAYSNFLPDEYKFDKRTQHPAMDIANALLNYAYGILYSEVEGALIKAGCDPYLGVMHRDEYNRPALAYDVIEVYRVWADYVVFRLLEQEVITSDFFSKRDEGSVWLEGLGRRVLIQSMNDYLDEVIPVSGVQRTRLTQITLHAQKLAQTFKNITD